ncbi:MAG TPA: hypothetical protein VF572_00890, partial [Candidatus Saccharimonadales bacterium]
MKYRITVDIDGDTFAKGDYTVKHGDFVIGVLTDDDKAVRKIYVEKTVGPEDKLPSIEPGHGPVKHVFNFNTPAWRNELIEKLIYLESLGSFWWKIRSIALREAEEEWVPESEEDEKKLSIIRASMKASYPRNPQPMHNHQIIELLDMEEDEKAMVTPLAFYREGTINFESHKYINAFQNYFLMIEGLFGQGKSGNAAQIKALVSSEELKEAADKMIAKIESDKSSPHYKLLLRELGSLGVSLDSKGILNWLVRTRGQLSHFSVKITSFKTLLLSANTPAYSQAPRMPGTCSGA